MTKTVYDLTNFDVEQFIKDKEINHCPLCRKENTIIPIIDEDSNLVYKTSNLLRHNTEKQTFEPLMEAYDILISCTHCGYYTSLAPVILADHFSLPK